MRKNATWILQVFKARMVKKPKRSFLAGSFNPSEKTSPIGAFPQVQVGAGVKLKIFETTT